MCGFLHFLPRRHKLHIIRPASSGRSYSFHCASSPQKVVKLFGAPDKGKYLCTSALAKCKILLAFSQSPQRVELHFFLNEHLFLHAETQPLGCVFCLRFYSLLYSSSVTGSHHSLDVSSPGTSTARWENQLSFFAPCQCLTLAGITTTSPGFRLCAALPSS